MEQNYDFSKIGKQMPYTVPDGFFDELEENVMSKCTQRARIIRIAIRTALAIAACIVLLLVVKVVAEQGVEVLEHAGRGAGRGHELLNLLALDGVGVFGLQFSHLVLVEAQDAVIHSRRTVDVGEGEALLEVGELLFHLCGFAPALSHKFLIFECEFQLHNRDVFVRGKDTIFVGELGGLGEISFATPFTAL